MDRVNINIIAREVNCLKLQCCVLREDLSLFLAKVWQFRLDLTERVRTHVGSTSYGSAAFGQKLMGFYGAIVLAMAFTQIGWALVNWMRFAGKRDRRRERERVVDMGFSEPVFLTETIDIAAWQDAKRLAVHHRATDAKIVSVETI